MYRLISLVIGFSLIYPTLSYCEPRNEESLPVTAESSVMRQWRPAVAIAGEGDEALAIKNLGSFISFQRTLSKSSSYSADAKALAEGVWHSFEKFNLNHFYDFLPQVDGEWRSMQIYGTERDSGYKITTGEPIKENVGRSTALGDIALVVKAKPLERQRRFFSTIPSYALSADYQFGMGNMTHQGVKSAIHEVAMLASPVAAKKLIVEKERAEKNMTKDFYSKAKVNNPLLGTEDILLVAPLWQAYPHFGDWLATLGVIEDVIAVNDSSGLGESDQYRHVNLKLALEPHRFRMTYPSLAKHFENMGKALDFSLTVNDENGKLFTLDVDSDTLTFDLDVYISDQGLLPVKDGKVLVDRARSFTEDNMNLTANVDANLKVHGIVYHLKGIGSDVTISQLNNAMDVDIYTNKVPHVTVDGYALGIFPTDFADIFLPKTIDQLMHDFFVVACNSRETVSEKQGIHFNVNLQEDTQLQQSNFRFFAELEGKNSLLVRFVMGELNDMLITDRTASEDFTALLIEAQDAFSKDLSRYTELVSTMDAEGIVGYR